MPTPSRRSPGRTSQIVSALLMSLAAPVLAAPEQPFQRVVWAAQRLTIVAEDTALDALLREVAVKTGSRVVGLEHATERVTVDIGNARLLDAIRQLLGSADVNYIYIPRPSHSPVVDSVVVWLYGASTPRPAAMRVALVVDASEPAVTGGPVPLGGYVPPAPPDDEAIRLKRESAFGAGASQSTLISLTKAQDHQVRILALQSPAPQSTPAGLDAIRQALRDEHPFVRAQAMGLLVSQSRGAATVDRLASLLDDENTEVRGGAALALGEQSGAETEHLLRRALEDGDRAVRGFAAQSLRQKAASEKPKR